MFSQARLTGVLTGLALYCAVAPEAQAESVGTELVIRGDAVRAATTPDREVLIIDVLADGFLCTDIRVSGEGAYKADANGDIRVELGLRSQAAACGKQGAELSFVTREGRVLQESLLLKNGENVLQSMTGEKLDRPTTWLSVPPPVAGSAELVQALDVFAGGELCGRLGLREGARLDEFGDFILPLDGPGSPAACAADGTPLTIRDQRGFELFRHPVVVHGGRTQLTGLGPVPPGTGTQAAAVENPGGGPSALGVLAIAVLVALVALLGCAVVLRARPAARRTPSR